MVQAAVGERKRANLPIHRPPRHCASHFKLVNERGQVNDGDVQALRTAGSGDEAIVEILAHVALNLFTNDVNVAFAVPVDYPAVPARGLNGSGRLGTLSATVTEEGKMGELISTPPAL